MRAHRSFCSPFFSHIYYNLLRLLKWTRHFNPTGIRVVGSEMSDTQEIAVSPEFEKSGHLGSRRMTNAHGLDEACAPIGVR